MRLKSIFLTTVSVTALSVGSLHANPQGGIVSAGAATIAESGVKTDIHQTTDNAVIDWRSFDIAPGEHTRFHQPSNNAMTLNRVHDTDASHINGQLSANGNIAIINPNGVLFGNQARVDVSGLVASTANISNDDFMAGNMKLDQSGNPDGAIINHGTITAKEAGLVGFVAPQVENHGTITANLGKVQLASGDKFALDMYGDGLIDITVSDDVAHQLIRNTGTIDAKGGQVVLSAAEGKQVINQLIDVSGSVNADTHNQHTGNIKITAPTEALPWLKQADIEVSGTISAKGNNAGEQGGDITLTSHQVAVQDGAIISTSASHDAGTIKIGGERLGQGDTPTAQRAYVAPDAIITANATLSGDGGEVIVWSDNRTDFYGSIEAKGGTASGNGGFIETSGKQVLNMQGSADASAPNGKAGQWLLDPTNVTLSAGGTTDPTSGGCGGGPFTCNGDASVNIGNLEAALDGGNDVAITTISGNGDVGNLTVADPVNWTGSGALTLAADENIIVNGSITSIDAAAALTLIAADGIDINNDISVGGAFTATTSLGNMTNIDANISAEGITLNTVSQINTDSIDVDANAGDFTINGNMRINATGATLYAGDYDINADISNIAPSNGHISFGTHNQPGYIMAIGDGETGNVRFSDAELDHIQDGFNRIGFFNRDNGQGINIGAYSWRDQVSFRANNNPLNVNGTQTANNIVNYQLRGNDINLNADLIGSGNTQLFLASIRDIGGAVSTGLSDAELEHIIDGWRAIQFFFAYDTVTIAPDTYEFKDPTTFLNAANQETFVNTPLRVAAGSDGSFTFGRDNGTPDRLTINADIDTSAGDGTGGIAFDNILDVGIGADLTTGGGDITFGDSIANVGGIVGSGNRTYNAGSGTISFGTAGYERNFASTFLMAEDYDINGDFDGVGNIIIRPNNGVTLAVGDGQAGTAQLSNAELDYLEGNRFLIFNNVNGDKNIAARDWSGHNGSIQFQTVNGDININGNQNLGLNSFRTVGPSVNVNGTLSGSGNLSFDFGRNGVGNDVAGATIDDTELARIQDGWSAVQFHISTGDMEVNTSGNFTISDPVIFAAQTGRDITINSSIVAAVGSDAAVSVDTINAGNNGTLTINEAVDLSDASAGEGAISFDNTDNVQMGADLTTAGGDITFANGVGSAENVVANGGRIFNAGSGNIFMGTGGYTGNFFGTRFQAADFDINGDIYGHIGIVTPNGSTLAIGDGQAGDAHLSNAELNHLKPITAQNSNLSFFGTAASANYNIGAYNWADWNLIQIINVNGGTNFNGASQFNNSDVRLTTRNININAPLSGSGELQLDNLLSIGDNVAGATLTNAELAQIQDGWSTLHFRAYGGFGAAADFTFDTGATYTLSDPIKISGNGRHVIINNDLNALAGSDASLTFEKISGGEGNTTSFTMNGDIDFSEAAGGGAVDIANIVDDVTLNGNITTAGGDVNLNQNNAATLSGNRTVNAGNGAVTVGVGGINAAANDLTLTADNMTISGDVNGSGTLTLGPSDISRAINFGDGTVGGLDISTAELARIGTVTDFSTIAVGSTAHTGILTLGDATSNSNLTLDGGVVVQDGNLNAGANTVSITAHTGNIDYVDGTITADMVNLDSNASMSAQVNATTLDIGTNSTDATITGFVNGGQTQTEADMITGGPGNDANYTFEGLIIRAAATPPVTPPSPSTPSTPTSEPTAPLQPTSGNEQPENPVIPETPLEPVSPPIAQTPQSPEVVIATGLPPTVEQVTAIPTLSFGSRPLSFAGFTPESLGTNKTLTSPSEATFLSSPMNEPYIFEPLAYDFEYLAATPRVTNYYGLNLKNGN